MSRGRRFLEEADEPEAETALLVCRSCGDKFEAMEPGMDQAFGCAATVREGTVTGHFGSTHIDMEVWQFRPGAKPLWVADGMLCDVCIKRLQDADAITLLEGGVF